MHIRQIKTSDSPAAARLHLQHLHSNFTGRPGYHLLRLYYQAVACQVGGCGFVVENVGHISGFICGVWDKKAIYRTLITRHFFPLCFWAASQALIQPSVILLAIKKLISKQPEFPTKGYELRPIVVSIEARGTGAAAKLVERLFEDAAKKGFLGIHLMTEQDNIAAQKLYQKMGFKEVGCFHRLSTNYLVFKKEVKY
jgi:ribosomal protein S18 acetylase RimI-like enzyme